MAFIPIFGTGFEMGSTKILYNTEEKIKSGGARTGSYCAQFDKAPTVFRLPTAGSELYFGMWLSVTSWHSHKLIFYLTDESYISIVFNDPYLQITINSGTVVATGATPLNLSQWYNLKIHLKIDDSTGAVDVYVDGILDVYYSGDTKPTSATEIYKINFGANYFVSGYGFVVDDFVYGTGGYPLDYRFTSIIPSADTAQKDFLRSTGSDNYALIDEVPPSASDYVYSSTDTAKDLFELSDYDPVLSDNTYVPQFTVHWMQAWKDPVNTQKIKFVQKLDATENASSAIDVSATAYLYSNVELLDPEGNAWSESALDDLQLGHEADI